MPRHIITELLKIKTKILQAAREHALLIGEQQFE